MNFKDWILLEDSKSLAKAYVDLLKDVPQDPNHHPEGNALLHIQLVRKSVPKAIATLKSIKNREPFTHILSDINFDVTPLEKQILYLAAWLHDIGKSTATTVGGINFNYLRQMDIMYQMDGGKIKSIGHDAPQHYMPQINRLKDLAPESTKDLYVKNKDLINFLIDHHMDLMNSDGFSSSFVREHFVDGKLINSQKIKLLLILMWSDKMGRTEETIPKSIRNNEERLIASSNRSVEQKRKAEIEQQKAKAKGFNSPEQMIDILTRRGLTPQQVQTAVQNKFPGYQQITKGTE